MTVVVQSVAAGAPAWVRRCVASVAAWAASCGFGYSSVGDDELFAGLRPSLPATDLGRLRLLRRVLPDRAVWVDADVLVFDPAVLSVDATFGACREVWVTGGRTLHLVCNAVVSVSDAAWLDDVLAETERRYSEGVHDRALGPDLFTSLHRARPFDLLAGWGVLSPMVVRAVAAGGGRALEVQAAAQPLLGAVNLCASMAGEEAVWGRAVDQLTASGSWPLAFSASLHRSHTGSFLGSREGTNTAPHSASSGVPRT